MNIIRRHAFSTILIFLTALVLAGCAPNYYTRNDGLKMSTEERIEVCKRLRSAAGLPDQYNINLPSSSAYRQQENLSEIRRQARRNAEESMSNLDCSSVLDVLPGGLTQHEVMAYESRVTYEVIQAMDIPYEAWRYIPKEWTWKSRDSATPDLTGTEWVATSFFSRNSGCPKTLRFLPKGRLVVSRDWVIDEQSRNKVPEYGRAEEGRWSQKQTRIYLQFKIEKRGEKDPKTITFHGFGDVSVRNVNGREDLSAELSLEGLGVRTHSESVCLGGEYEIMRR